MGKPRLVWSPAYEVEIGRHVFPTAKYRRVREWLLKEGIVGDEDFVLPHAVGDEVLARVHTPEYLRKIREDCFSPLERYELEVPFSKALEQAARVCCGGTLLAGRLALEDGVAIHLGGGFHHAFADHGEGFCLLNDVAVAIMTLLDEESVSRVMVVDLDVHQGNGTAAIFGGDPRVCTVSIHQDRNYPALKPTSDLDFGLPDGIGDEAYLATLDATLDRALGRCGPGVVFYLAGADPYCDDRLGGLGLTKEGLRQRDAMVLGRFRDQGVPVAVTLAGGYACQECDTVEIHANTVVEAVRLFETASR